MGKKKKWGNFSKDIIKKRKDSDLALSKLKKKLEDEKKDNLVLLCRKLLMKGYSRAKNKSELIEFILTYVSGDPLEKSVEESILRKFEDINSILDTISNVVYQDEFSNEKDISSKNKKQVLEVLNNIEDQIIKTISKYPIFSNYMVQEGFFLILTSELNKLPVQVASRLVKLHLDQIQDLPTEIIGKFPKYTSSTKNDLQPKFNLMYKTLEERISNNLKSSRIIISEPVFHLLLIGWYFYYFFTEKLSIFMNDDYKNTIFVENDILDIFTIVEISILRIGKSIFVNSEIGDFSILEEFCTLVWNELRLKLHPQPWLLYY